MLRLAVSLFLGILLAPLPTLAHHSAAGFYDEDVFLEIEGEIVAVLWRNPHVSYTIRTTDEDGHEAIWEIEGASVNRLSRRGLTADMMQVGAHVKIAGNPSREGRHTMEVTNMLLPSGEELLLLNPNLPSRGRRDRAGHLPRLESGFRGRQRYRRAVER